MALPIIGILLDYDVKRVKDGGYSNHPWYALRHHYSTAIAIMGGLPILIPYEKELICSYMNLCHGIVAPGANFDIHPSYYKEKLAVKSIKPFPNDFRTNFEFSVIHAVLKRKMPLLAICGGFQSLNVTLGGSLYQDIKEQLKTKINHVKGHHRITVEHGSKLHDITRTDSYKVNSFHHQAIKYLGRDLIKTAIADDGVIEAIEHSDMPFCIGVEWHPELLDCYEDKILFEAFIAAAKKYRQ